MKVLRYNLGIYSEVSADENPKVNEYWDLGGEVATRHPVPSPLLLRANNKFELGTRVKKRGK